jgi:predicted CxxxxCH...CXXCH cytochrome family protein
MKNQCNFVSAAILSLSMLCVSCSDQLKNLPTATPAGAKIHDAGWADTSAANFHGAVLKHIGYDASSCVTCHAQQFNGGTSGVSCVGCHASYPHATGWASPTVSTYHGNYLSTKNFDATSCKDCHGANLAGGSNGPSCFGCHSQYPHTAGWTQTTSSNFHGIEIKNSGWNMTTCKSCHGSDYAGGISHSSCNTCHTKSNGPENCTTCHGSANAAPPQDLGGHTAASFTGVGTHQTHMLAPDTLGTVVACNECHKVPAAFTSAGHIDTTAGAEVLFQGSVVTSSLASAGTPTYSKTTLRCSNTYCHGNFPNGNNVTVSWKDTTGQQHACGSCHGDASKADIASKALPKTAALGGTHPNDLGCYKCHPNVIDAAYKFKGNLHMNGRLD